MSMPRARTSQRPFFYGILGLLFLNLLLFSDILFDSRGQVLSSSQADLFLHFAAWRQFGFDQLRQGHLILWNPHYLCGTPFLGNFESALLYPFNWIFLVLPLGAALNAGLILHVFLAGLFTFLWAFHRGIRPLSCFTAGVVFMWGGAFYLHLFAGHLPNLCAMVWAPLIFLSLDGLLDKPSLRWVLLGIFAVAMQILAGHPQYVYFTAIIAGIYLLLNLKGNQAKWRVLGTAGAIYAGASLVTAVQLWTGAEAFLECARNIPLEFKKASSFSFPPQNILTLVLPGFFGNLTTAHYWSQWFLWEVSLFIGSGAFFLVLTGVFFGKPGVRKWALATAAIALVLSLGSSTPLYPLLYHYAPLFKGMRGICKFDFLISLFLAMLCGIGLDTLIKNKKFPRGPVMMTGIMGLMFFGGELWILNSIDQGLKGGWGQWFSSIGWLKSSFSAMDLPAQEQYLKEAGLDSAMSLFIGGCSCLFLTALFSFRKLTPVAVYSVVGLVILELFLFARQNRPTFELSTLEKKYDQIRNFYQKNPGEYRVYGTGSASLVTGGLDLWEDEPMVLGRYGRFVCYSQGLSENQLFSVLPIYQRFHPVFAMMRLKYRVWMDQGPARFYPLPLNPLPRMLLVNHWEVMPDSARVLPALFAPGFDPAQKVFLEQNPDPLPGGAKTAGVVKWKDLTTDRVEIEADTPQASLLLVTDNYSAGWKGEALPGSAQSSYQVLPADYFLRAIPLSAGKHHFILEYRPFAFVLGKWVSIFSCLIYVVVLILCFRKNVLFH